MDLFSYNFSETPKLHMADRTSIEWTDATWNPIAGCSIVSPGCTNCYAMKMAARLEAMGQGLYMGLTQPSKAGPVWTGIIRLAGEQLAGGLTHRKNGAKHLFSEADIERWNA